MSTKKSLERVGTFEAKDSDGRVHTLHVFSNVTRSVDLDGNRHVNHGLKDVRTSDGYHVNVLGGRRYEIVETGTALESDDPNAI